MGKENWYWGGSARSSSNSKRSGCMCALFHAFDFHPFHFSINHHQQQPSNFNSASGIPKGTEAHRNSLESEDGTVASISQEETLKIPKIRTSGSTIGSFSDFSSEISISSSSPLGTKTPTLVARLMGLDLLPDSFPSSFSASSSHLSTQNKPRQRIKLMKHRNSTDNIVATHSLPETPRMSSTRRSDESSPGKLSIQSYSPRPSKFKHKPSTKPPSPIAPKLKSVQKHTKITQTRNKQEKSFIIRSPPNTRNRTNHIKTKSKRTHHHHHPLSTKIPQKQVKTQSSQVSTGDGDEVAEYEYIKTLLSRTGHKDNFDFEWFSCTNPLDPLLFHSLEHYYYFYPLSSSSPDCSKDCNFRHLGPRCNRRLVFDCVDELLSEILVNKGKGLMLLVETVWERVQRFPRARCEALEDIDGLIEMEDVQGKKKEEEGLVKEIEGEILEMLVNQTLTVMVAGAGNGET